MLNFPETIRTNPTFHKFEIGDILFAKYTCPLKETDVGLWTSMDYLVHVVSGRKTWRTIDGEWDATAGQTLFFRKGACIVRQHFSEAFCLVMFFLPDAFVREVVAELGADLPRRQETSAGCASGIRVNNDTALSAFIHSMLAYFAGEQEPSPALLRLKLKELIVSILVGPGNPDLATYLVSLARRGAPSVGEIMEANFRFKLSLAEYAALCHRSLSSFKRDFQVHFGEPPGKWLINRRLEYARALIERPELSITDVAFESGFEDVSHFSRAFKARFGAPPSGCRPAAG